jgi:hypothetical protein
MKLIAAQVDFTAEHAETAEKKYKISSASFAVSAVRVGIFYAFSSDTDNCEQT